MYAVPSESTGYIVDLYRRAWAHADRTITELDLDDIGTTPHTGDRLRPNAARRSTAGRSAAERFHSVGPSRSA
jgi:hypothetical protein